MPIATPAPSRFALPHLGYGVGLRMTHAPALLAPSDPEGRPDWLEAISENFMATGGPQLDRLLALRERYPVVLHGVSLSIGSTDPLDRRYLRELRRLADLVRPAWVSDHLCWTGVLGRTSHDLLPLPATEEALRRVIDRVRAVEDALGRPLVLENPSTYLAWRSSTMSELEMLSRVAEEADAGILLDVNNVYVCARNHGFDARKALAPIPWDRVVQIHLAGHTDKGDHVIDTHDAPVVDPVWDLYAEAVRRTGGRSTLIEWDASIPPLPRVLEEARKAERLAEGVLAKGGRARRPGEGRERATRDRAPTAAAV